MRQLRVLQQNTTEGGVSRAHSHATTLHRDSHDCMVNPEDKGLFMGQKFELPACFCTFWRVFCSLGVNHMWFVAEFISLLTYIFAHGLCGTVHRSLYSSHKLKYPLHVFLFFPFLVQEVLPVDVSRSAEICTGKKHQQTSHVSVQHLS